MINPFLLLKVSFWASIVCASISVGLLVYNISEQTAQGYINASLDVFVILVSSWNAHRIYNIL
jgi:hypothetical protein